MKKYYKLKYFLVLFLVISLIIRCTNEFEFSDLQEAVQTNEYNSITQTTVNVSGTVLTDNGSNLSARGICYGIYHNPSISDFKKLDLQASLGSFTCSLTNLSPSTTYYARAFATNSNGTAYGEEISFKTLAATIPIINSTTAVSSITHMSAISGGIISNSGASNITSRGVCYSKTNQNPTILDFKTTDGTGVGQYTSSLSNLTSNSLYYIRAYATNGVGTAYGNVLSFTTLPALVLGQSYQGGTIAYIFVSGDSGYISGQIHGLIASTYQYYGAQWGCSGTSINTSTSFGTGQSNTSSIVNGCSTLNTAARICNDLIYDGYSDWYLPSLYDLQKLYTNKTVIGGFSNSNYWSSSQVSSTMSYGINFSNGTFTSISKSSNIYVRPIRKF